MAKVCIKLLVTGIILFIAGIIGMAVLEVNGYDAVYSLPVKQGTNAVSEVAVVDGGYTYYWDGEDDGFFTVDLENADTVRGLDIDVSAGNFTVMTGDELSVSGYEVDLNRLEYGIENGILHVSYSPEIYLFNWDFDGDNTDIIITLPPKVYDTANFTVKAGELNVMDFETSKLSIDLAAGEHYFSNVSAAKSAQIKMTAGNCTLENCVFNDADIKMTAGEMYWSFCELVGENNLKMTAGDLYMDLVGNRSDYEISVDKTAGSLYIDGDTFGRGDYEYSATTYEVAVTEQVVTGQSEVSVQEKTSENASNSLDVQITAGTCNINFIPPEEYAPDYE